MPQLFVPLDGPFGSLAGSGYNASGQSLDWPHWSGAELGGLDSFGDVMGAVAEAEFHDWIIGVRHPLYSEGGAAPCRFTDGDAAARREALQIASAAAEQAKHLGARYIRFPFPGVSEEAETGTGEQMYDIYRYAFEQLTKVQADLAINIVLQIAGLHLPTSAGARYTRLFLAFPTLSLCLDAGEVAHVTRTAGQDPSALCRPWLPWARYMRLYTTLCDQPHGSLIAEMVAQAQPRCAVVLAHDLRSLSHEARQEAHDWAASLVSGRAINDG